MEWNFDFRRVLILVVCLAGFALLGGFKQPVVEDGYHSQTRVTKAWVACVMMFIGGAVCVSIVDHTVGTMDLTNLRPGYIVMGVLLMGGAIFWDYSAREALRYQPEAVGADMMRKDVCS